MPPRLTEEQLEALKHHNAVTAMQAVLLRPEGKALIKYLFDVLEVGKLPDLEFSEVFGKERFMDKIGSLRAGRAIFELASEADPETSGYLLAQLEKERYETLRAEQLQNEQG